MNARDIILEDETFKEKDKNINYSIKNNLNNYTKKFNYNDNQSRNDNTQAIKNDDSYNDVTPVVSDKNSVCSSYSTSENKEKSNMSNVNNKFSINYIIKNNRNFKDNKRNKIYLYNVEKTLNNKNNRGSKSETPEKFNAVNNNINENRNNIDNDFNTLKLKEQFDNKSFNQNDTKVTNNKIEEDNINEINVTIKSKKEQREKIVSSLLFKIKTGTLNARKSALKQLISKANVYTQEVIFNQILSLFININLNPKERHDLVKIINNLLNRFGKDLTNETVKKILMHVSPMLIDEEFYTRLEGKEIIANLSKSIGLPSILFNVKPDVDSEDDKVRVLASKVLAIVGSANGVTNIIPFIKAILNNKLSSNARVTALKTINYLGIIMKNSILPHLHNLVNLIEDSKSLEDENNKVRTQSALSIASLAEASYPYGANTFIDNKVIFRNLLEGVINSRYKTLTAYLKAVGFIIPLMDGIRANKTVNLIINVIKREYSSNDEDLKRIVISVTKQIVITKGIDKKIIKDDILNNFINSFWDRRIAVDRRNFKLVVETTFELANKLGSGEVIKLIINDKLQDENPNLRYMAIDTIQKIVDNLGLDDFESKYEENLIEGLLLNFQNYETEEPGNHVIQCIASVLKALSGSNLNLTNSNNNFMLNLNINGVNNNINNNNNNRARKFIQQIFNIIEWRMSNKSARVRMYAVDLISNIAFTLNEQNFKKLQQRIYSLLIENLGEEYPEVLGSIINALYNLISKMSFDNLDPPIRELFPKISPILKNQNLKVQENILQLIDIVAKNSSDQVSAKEWMRVCFDLIEILKTTRKSIRRAAIYTFGLISKAIGPQDVLLSLLDNLKVQERQYRVCTTLAIAVIADSCGPYTVIPALLNEYRFNELNIQNGVLKSFNYMFEYIGDQSKDYLYSIVGLLEHALTEKELVHRQLAAGCIKHIALNVFGNNCEDILINLLNYMWPSLFEESDHLITSIIDALEGLRIGLGPSIITKYIVQGLFHPARKVRVIYWKIFNNLYIGSNESTVYSCLMLLPFVTDRKSLNNFKYFLDFKNSSIENNTIKNEANELNENNNTNANNYINERLCYFNELELVI